jgi:glucose dehydrogenase
VVDGVMYVSGPWSVVMALDAHRPRAVALRSADGATARRGCCDVVNRGVAYADGKVFSTDG